MSGKVRNQWRRGAMSVATLALAGSLGLTGCGSSGNSAGNSAGPTGAASPPATGAATTGAPAPGGGSTSGGSGGAGSASAADVAAIKQAYSLFFSPDTPQQVSLNHLQNGPAFESTIDQKAGGDLASGASAKVSKVTLLSPDTAKVVWTIFVNSQPMLQDQTGYAVKEGGTWKVAAYTFCALLKLQGSPPQACSQPSATAPPK